MVCSSPDFGVQKTKNRVLIYRPFILKWKAHSYSWMTARRASTSSSEDERDPPPRHLKLADTPRPRATSPQTHTRSCLKKDGGEDIEKSEAVAENSLSSKTQWTSEKCKQSYVESNSKGTFLVNFFDILNDPFPAVSTTTFSTKYSCFWLFGSSNV